MPVHETLNYVEFGACDLSATKAFFKAAFDWEFVDYGPDYTAFSQPGLDGGFFTSTQCSHTSTGGALLVFYSADILATQGKVLAAGGVVVRALFEFPGGWRFHFVEPSGNEFAVWSQSGAAAV